MITQFLDSLSIPAVYLGTAVFILFFYEVGYQIGKYLQPHYRKNGEGLMVTSILTMLAFVLAFTFSMAAARFDKRKEVVVNEANAIGTAYLRADLLAQPHREKVKRFLREYVDTRLQGIEKTKRKAAIARSLELHKLLWSEVTAAAKENPSMLSALLIQSTNEIIDLHEKRITAALRNRIPGSIWLMLYAITALAMLTMGSQAGLTKMRRMIQTVPMVLAFSALITLVVDLDRTDLGLARVSQQAMFNLQSSMKGGME